MKLLRQTIRKILLENTGHYDKIATLLCARDPATINQGIELAKTMGYITKSSYDGGSPTYWNKDLFNHQWMLTGLDPELTAALENEWKGDPSDNHRMWPSMSLDNVPGWHIVIDAHEE